MPVDAHQRVWDLAVRDQPWPRELPSLRRSFVFEDLAPSLGAQHFDAAVLVQTIGVAEETPEPLRLAGRTRQIVGIALTFALDHAGKPPIASGERESWGSHISELAGLWNCAVTLSGFVTEACPDWTTDHVAPYAARVLDAFGPGRIMYGSHWSVCLLTATYDQVAAVAGKLTARLSQDEQGEVFGGTAARCYGLQS
jgi:predicted TIM-barrel fold metal-dependent hydrolase